MRKKKSQGFKLKHLWDYTLSINFVFLKKKEKKESQIVVKKINKTKQEKQLKISIKPKLFLCKDK